MNRRQFLQTTAAGIALSSFGGLVPAFAQPKPKRVALIGTGWYGKSALFRLLQIAPVEVVALCDVDRNMVAEAAQMIAARQVSKKTPRTYGDYRQMLKQEELDIVHVATPDHWHALAMIAAVQAGADVYVEKPISTDIVEGQAMLAAARKYGRMVQVNMQRRSTPHLIEARKRVIEAGLLGNIAHVEICCYYHMRARGQAPEMTPPEHLDYEMWTGPAPMRPYNRWVHPRGWRAFMEYGNGIVGDMCVHMLDMVRWLLDLGWPTRIGSTGGILVDKASTANTNDTQIATVDFGGCPSSGPIAPGAAPPIRSTHGAASFMATRARSRSMSTSMSSSRKARASGSAARPSTNTTSIPKTRPRRTWSGTSRPRCGATGRTSSMRSRRGPGPSATSSRATSPRPRASWRIWPARSAAPSSGIRSRAR